MATSTVTVTREVAAAAELRKVADLLGVGGSTSLSQQSTADANIGSVKIRSVDQLATTNAAGQAVTEYAEYTFRFAPTDIKVDGLSDNYTQIERPGLRPLVRRQSRGALKVAFSVKIVDPDEPGTASAEPYVVLLSSIASLNVDLFIIGLGPLVTGIKFRLTDMSATTERMNPAQQITVASVNLTFTQVVDVGTVVPGMSLLKNTYPSLSIKSGTKGSTNTDEIDYWTAAKKAAQGT